MKIIIVSFVWTHQCQSQLGFHFRFSVQQHDYFLRLLSIPSVKVSNYSTCCKDFTKMFCNKQSVSGHIKRKSLLQCTMTKLVNEVWLFFSVINITWDFGLIKLGIFTVYVVVLRIVYTVYDCSMMNIIFALFVLIQQQISELKKENFGLKLRIYFLEQQNNTDIPEDVFKAVSKTSDVCSFSIIQFWFICGKHVGMISM